MSKQVWVNQYERLMAENPTATEEELWAMADEAMADELSSAVDAAHDARKHGD